MTPSHQIGTSAGVALLLVAGAAFSIASVIDSPIWSVVASVSGVAAAVASILVRRQVRLEPVVIAGSLAFLVTIGSATQLMGTFAVQPGSYRFNLLLALATSGWAIASVAFRFRRSIVILSLAAFLVGTLTVLVPNWQPELSTDVYRAHQSAGRAMAAGQNAYSDAVVFESGDPNKPDGTLVYGYPYPLPALTTYGVAATFTDSRLVSAVAWATFVLLLAWLAWNPGRRGDIALAALVLVGTAPLWRMTLFVGWTEPVSVALLGFSLLGVLSGRRWGWLILGVALASKQYFILLIPAVLLYRDPLGKRPGWWSIGIAGLLALVPALLGPTDYFRSVIQNPLGIGFRPDTQSLNGVIAQFGGDFVIPSLLVIPLVLGICWAMRDVGPRLAPVVGTVAMAVAFLATSAFPNYWLLLMAMAVLCAVSLATGDDDGGAVGAKGTVRPMNIRPAREKVPENPLPLDLPE